MVVVEGLVSSKALEKELGVTVMNSLNWPVLVEDDLLIMLFFN